MNRFGCSIGICFSLVSAPLVVASLPRDSRADVKKPAAAQGLDLEDMNPSVPPGDNLFVRNLDASNSAFDVKPSQTLHLAPSDRGKIS